MAKQFKHDELEFARAVTFFDAIFAFAVTLLITTVDDFSPDAWSSWQALKDTNGPSLLAFTISFVVVVSFWRANHQQVTAFDALDSRLITLNCMVMFGIVLIPFATEAMGKVTDLPLPTAVYAVVISATYLMQAVVLFVADSRGMNGHKLTPLEKRWELVESIPLPLIFLGSIPVAYLVSPGDAQRCWIILAVLMPAVGALHSRALKGAVPPAGPVAGS
ncbi:MAG: TMEM175 family protein [Nakamurella sp.]